MVSSRDSYGIYFSKPEHGTVGWAGADYGVYAKAVLRAIDYQTGKIRWSHDLGGDWASAGVLTTDSGLLFTGDSVRNAMALRTSDGATLWHAAMGHVGNSPITYELSGREYVIFASDGSLFAWALPEKSVKQTKSGARR
jgi:alcohol dehydrogenase (cytochrome c)